jgi:hypothetical protein
MEKHRSEEGKAAALGGGAVLETLKTTSIGPRPMGVDFVAGKGRPTSNSYYKYLYVSAA